MNCKRRIVCTIAVLFLGAAPLHAQETSQAMWVFVDSEPAQAVLAIEATGAKVRYTSRWLKAVSVNADAKTLERLKTLTGVTGMQPVGLLYATRTPASTHQRINASTPHRKLAPHRISADFDSAFYGPNYRAIRDLGIPSSHTLGFTGRNIRIAILDTGFEPAHEALLLRRIVAQRDFINTDGVVANQPGEANTSGALDQEVHGTLVWSLLGGHQPGKIVGPAFDANFILAKVDLNQPGTEDVAADEDRWVAAVEWADSMGARIINSSLTYRDFTDKPDYPITALDGKTTLATRMADEAARRGILVVNAIGNFGPAPTSLWAPADADSIIAVGAVDEAGQPARFSNGSTSGAGPTVDGRLKPELVALGVGLTGANAADPGGYLTNQEGTSFSTPLIAGGAAMFMQAWPNLTIMAVRNALMLSGSRAEFPDNNVGYGVPNISGAILFPEGLLAIGITGVNLQNQLTTIQPTFTWSAPLVNQQMLPVRYRLEIATDPTFNTIIYSDTTSGSSLTLKRPLQPAQTRYWRVVAEAFPNIRRTTRLPSPFSVPDWVRLLTFTQPNSVSDSLQPTFRWEALAAPPPSGPLTYDFQILSGQTGAVISNMTNLTTASARPLVPLTPNIPFRWRIIAKSPTGLADTVQTEHVFIVTSTGKPPATLLYQNFPNPFPNAGLGETSTRIWFDVNERSDVQLAVYDLRGRLVRQLIPSAPSCGTVTLEPGIYGRTDDPDTCVLTVWDGRDTNGGTIPRGVYILRLRAGGTDQIKKILYMP